MTIENVMKLLKCFPRSYMNYLGECILCEKGNVYFTVKNCETETDIKCDYAKAHDVAIKALDQVAKLREFRKNLAEKERFYANESNDNTLYSNGLADAYCTVNALIDEILGDIEE